MSSALIVGSWRLEAVPPGWEVLPGYGIRRSVQGQFPSVLLMAEEAMPEGVTLERYVRNQMEVMKVLLRQPNIKGPTPFPVEHAAESQRLAVAHRTPDGRSVVQFQIYATAAKQVGNVTFTTLEETLPSDMATLQQLLGGISFQAVELPPAAPNPTAHYAAKDEVL